MELLTFRFPNLQITNRLAAGHFRGINMKNEVDEKRIAKIEWV